MRSHCRLLRAANRVSTHSLIQHVAPGFPDFGAASLLGGALGLGTGDWGLGRVFFS
ncbi:MAG: hypothetical protein V7L26_11015 [Nostoc sp.]|uniref:hypothetical protein n=1 Tax=Nostoc sp. TaxID=1180 RepID=UPI002FF20FEC